MEADPVPAVREEDATGQVAEIFADIRETLGVGAVNLIWRHLATDLDGLDWAWRNARPVYASGDAQQAAAILLGELEVPKLPVLLESCLTSVGVTAADRPVLAAILDTYNRGNALNMIAGLALQVEPRDGALEPISAATVSAGSTVPLPPIPEVDALPADAADLVLACNAIGASDPPGPVIASIYKHLALWPGYLALTWAQLAPLHADGRLAAVIEATSTAARGLAARVASRHAVDGAGAAAERVRAALPQFTDEAIARMIPIGTMMRETLPDGSGERA